MQGKDLYRLVYVETGQHFYHAFFGESRGLVSQHYMRVQPLFLDPGIRGRNTYTTEVQKVWKDQVHDSPMSFAGPVVIW